MSDSLFKRFSEVQIFWAFISMKQDSVLFQTGFNFSSWMPVSCGIAKCFPGASDNELSGFVFYRNEYKLCMCSVQ